MKISLIVAMTEDRVIGKQNRLPWHLPEDLKRFKQTTMGHTLVMGRKTFESIGRPLPGRRNIVLSRNLDFRPGGVDVAPNLAAALRLAEQAGETECFIIGGASIYEAARPLVQRLYLTLLHKSFAGDAHFPAWNWREEFRIAREETGVSDDGEIPYTFLVAERLN